MKPVLALLLLLAVATPPAHAGDSNFVARPKGWMILLPPLSRPDHITGARTVLMSAPDRQWIAVVVRGYDGGSYDFSDEHGCKETLSALMLKTYFDANPGTIGKGKCVHDDGRRRVVAR